MTTVRERRGELWFLFWITLLTGGFFIYCCFLSGIFIPLIIGVPFLVLSAFIYRKLQRPREVFEEELEGEEKFRPKHPFLHTLALLAPAIFCIISVVWQLFD